VTRLADLCGTRRGVKAHRTIGEPPCPLCAEVKSAAALLARRPDLIDLGTPITRLVAGFVESA
jgi:hypothetical protein